EEEAWLGATVDGAGGQGNSWYDAAHRAYLVEEFGSDGGTSLVDLSAGTTSVVPGLRRLDEVSFRSADRVPLRREPARSEVTVVVRGPALDGDALLAGVPDGEEQEILVRDADGEVALHLRRATSADDDLVLDVMENHPGCTVARWPVVEAQTDADGKVPGAVEGSVLLDYIRNDPGDASATAAFLRDARDGKLLRATPDPTVVELGDLEAVYGDHRASHFTLLVAAEVPQDSDHSARPIMVEEAAAGRILLPRKPIYGFVDGYDILEEEEGNFPGVAVSKRAKQLLTGTEGRAQEAAPGSDAPKIEVDAATVIYADAPSGVQMSGLGVLSGLYVPYSDQKYRRTDRAYYMYRSTGVITTEGRWVIDKNGNEGDGGLKARTRNSETNPWGVEWTTHFMHARVGGYYWYTVSNAGSAIFPPSGVQVEGLGALLDGIYADQGGGTTYLREDGAFSIYRSTGVLTEAGRWVIDTDTDEGNGGLHAHTTTANAAAPWEARWALDDVESLVVQADIARAPLVASAVELANGVMASVSDHVLTITGGSQDAADWTLALGGGDPNGLRVLVHDLAGYYAHGTIVSVTDGDDGKVVHITFSADQEEHLPNGSLQGRVALGRSVEQGAVAPQPRADEDADLAALDLLRLGPAGAPTIDPAVVSQTDFQIALGVLATPLTVILANGQELHMEDRVWKLPPSADYAEDTGVLTLETRPLEAMPASATYLIDLLRLPVTRTVYAIPRLAAHPFAENAASYGDSDAYEGRAEPIPIYALPRRLLVSGMAQASWDGVYHRNDGADGYYHASVSGLQLVRHDWDGDGSQWLLKDGSGATLAFQGSRHVQDYRDGVAAGYAGHLAGALGDIVPDRVALTDGYWDTEAQLRSYESEPIWPGSALAVVTSGYVDHLNAPVPVLAPIRFDYAPFAEGNAGSTPGDASTYIDGPSLWLDGKRLQASGFPSSSDGVYRHTGNVLDGEPVYKMDGIHNNRYLLNYRLEATAYAQYWVQNVPFSGGIRRTWKLAAAMSPEPSPGTPVYYGDILLGPVVSHEQVTVNNGFSTRNEFRLTVACGEGVDAPYSGGFRAVTNQWLLRNEPDRSSGPSGLIAYLTQNQPLVGQGQWYTASGQGFQGTVAEQAATWLVPETLGLSHIGLDATLDAGEAVQVELHQPPAFHQNWLNGIRTEVPDFPDVDASVPLVATVTGRTEGGAYTVTWDLSAFGDPPQVWQSQGHVLNVPLSGGWQLTYGSLSPWQNLEREAVKAELRGGFSAYFDAAYEPTHGETLDRDLTSGATVLWGQPGVSETQSVQTQATAASWAPPDTLALDHDAVDE
ncbi:MAG: hypothetical protein VX265_02070, partial [Myxococcota bacterium]|nr:hypothetical protein [Myxococcota bacterium]